jgi:hypothetical protein
VPNIYIYIFFFFGDDFSLEFRILDKGRESNLAKGKRGEVKVSAKDTLQLSTKQVEFR